MIIGDKLYPKENTKEAAIKLSNQIKFDGLVTKIENINNKWTIVLSGWKKQSLGNYIEHILCNTEYTLYDILDYVNIKLNCKESCE